LRKIQADILFPVSAGAIPKGIIIADDSGKLIDVLDPAVVSYDIQDVEHYEGFLCPGFINAHSHLELAYLENKTSKHKGLDVFIEEISMLRTEPHDSEFIEEAMHLADTLMYENGIVAVCDIANSDASLKLKMKSRIHYHTFAEVYGSVPDLAEIAFQKGLAVYNAFYSRMPVSLTAHSFYAVSEKLFEKVKSFVSGTDGFFSIHHLESYEEILYFMNKTGKINTRLHKMDIDNSHFVATGKRPFESMSHLLPENKNILMVHNSFANASDRAHAQNLSSQFFWCLCPNSNVFIEGNLPPVDMFRQDGVRRVCVGTDSLASNTGLSILEELKQIQSNYDIPTEILLEWACLNGAYFMNLNENLGSFSKGKTPGILHIGHVDVPNLLFKKDSTVKRLL